MIRLTPWLCAIAISLGSVASAQDDGQVQATSTNETDATPAPAAATPVSTTSAPPAHETNCNDRQDDDGDGLSDCADADCYSSTFCQAGGQDERTDAFCSDWLDNDGDGATDCDDSDCQADHITVCRGSMQNPGAATSTSNAVNDDEIPELEDGQSIEDLIGRPGFDNDGERNDYMCSDGVDNDGDGRTDCADFGCRFDPSVTVCSSSPGIRFSVVAGIAGSFLIDEIPDRSSDGVNDFTDPTGDVRFTRIQLRALGAIPFINDSFFLINARAERTFRLTFATFNIPISNRGHYISINSGSGGLSSGLIVSTSKQPLLDPPFYLFNAFEQGNGAALDIGGPITDDGMLNFRIFGAGGSGEFNGNVGGRFFRSEDRNFSYSGGAQLQVNAIGFWSRFDSPFIYTPMPTTLAFAAGARFDQRPLERYTAFNAFGIFAYQNFLLRAESYSRYVFDFDGFQTAFNVQATVLLVPRTLMFAADAGGFFAPRSYDPAVVDSVGGFSSQLRRPLEKFQWRAALHWYYFRNIGLMSLMYRQTFNESNPDNPEDALVEHEARLEAQFRF